MSLNPGYGYTMRTSNGVSILSIDQPFVEYAAAGGGDAYKNQFQVEIESATVTPPGGGEPVTETRLKVIKGTALWGNRCLNQTDITDVDDRSPVQIFEGGNDNSPYCNKGGYCIIDENLWFVYLFNIKAPAAGGYVYEQVLYVCPEGNYSEVCPVVLPPELSEGYDEYEAQCIRIAERIAPNPVTQTAVGTLSFKPFVKPNYKDFEVYVKRLSSTTEGVVTDVDVMYCNKGTVIYLQGECVEAVVIEEFDSRSPVTIREDKGIEVDTGAVVNVYLYRIKLIPESGPVTYENVLFATSNPIDAQCPVVLPDELLPASGTYEAQRLSIGFAGGPYVEDGVLVGFNFLYGPVSWPTKPDSAHPFKVSAINETTYSVKTGAVNNAIPTNMTSTVTVTGPGFVWVAAGYDATNKVFPDPANITIGAGTSLPASDATTSYVALASVNAGVVTQLVTGSLWGDRIQVGSGASEDAYYYYSRV